MTAYEHVLVEKNGPVGIITLNRPRALNALNDKLIDEMVHAFDTLESDDAVRCLILTGGDKVFAAGADVFEMLDKTYIDAYRDNFVAQDWERISRCRKPVIAAVAGKVLGGGCELAMMCDFILAAENASFGVPEITVGTIGGIQRLTRFIGKSKAMEMILSGSQIDAVTAERAGLVVRVVPAAALMDEALACARRIAAMSLPIVMMAKECANRAYESTLAEGLNFERRVFHATFATEDRREGMQAFCERRAPVFRDR
ncbi:enoyl-CoA hydratase-related protein [Herbaspirillum sp. alder98]|uniref:enoyl-CoA hydratase-related protein n=1 Tax=Herbaspirillum sp. alder98 TaxID=2913096 RepID=UPI001CD83916|nr:enoyl-CoA hydratase-related protein [Herbaspirillum sp. alder98]MCA1326076.1 enoyl-CoA hydratase/isomerase family protein [Herbaspirillum sp. alder98]